MKNFDYIYNEEQKIREQIESIADEANICTDIDMEEINKILDETLEF